ncbi:MAG: hypothetical protein LKJ90_05695 [Faecalibacterium sp.]|jgi:Gpi18-like mannosyltransferase|nr:hypothetical protein [Faecalibacterium sp.]
MMSKTKNTAQRLLAAAGVTEENRSRFVIACIGLMGVAVLAAYGLLTCFDGDGEADRHLMYAAYVVFWAVGILCILPQHAFRVQGLMIFAQMLALGLMVRFMIAHGVSGDYNCYWQPWLETMRGLDVRQALVQEIGNYAMPYTYFLVWVSRLGFYDLFCIKLLSILFDVLCGVMLVVLARQAGFGQKGRLAVFFLYMFLPPFFLNSAYWAQCDSVYVLFCLAALACALKGRSAACWALEGVAFALKLQAIFLLPVLFVLLLTKKLKWRWLPLAPAAFLLLNVPALIAGRSLNSIFAIYQGQVGAFSKLTMNAGTFWGLFPEDMAETFAAAPYAVGAAVLLAFFYLFADCFAKMDTRQLLVFTMLVCYLEVYLLPTMHERYYYLPEALMLLYVLIYPKRWWLPAIQFFVTFTRYSEFLFNNGVEWISIIRESAIASVVAVCLVWFFYRDCHPAVPAEKAPMA